MAGTTSVCSSAVERRVEGASVGGSIPSGPTNSHAVAERLGAWLQPKSRRFNSGSRVQILRDSSKAERAAHNRFAGSSSLPPATIFRV